MIILLTRVLKVRPKVWAGALICSAAAAVLIWGAIFAAVEHFPVTTGWYWAVTTASTVGYGDVIPHNPSGRVVASLTMLTTIPMLAAAFALFTGSAVSAAFRRILQVGAPFPKGPFRLVLGMNSAVPRMLEELARARDPVVLVADVDPKTVPAEVHLIRGDPTSVHVVKEAHPERASHALIGAKNDGDALVIAVLLRENAPKVPVTALAGSATVAEALRELGVTQVVSSDELVAHTLAKTLEAPHAGDLLLKLIVSDGHNMVERVVTADEAVRPLSEVRTARDELVLGVVHDGAVSLGVGEDPDVAPGDVLLVVEQAKPHS